MRRILKALAGTLLIPLTRWYLTKERTYTYQQTQVKIFPGVFHPGLFASTLLILKYLEAKNLSEKKFLEVGSGTGLISVMAAKAGAQVTAIDISRAAVKNTEQNAKSNSVSITVLYSDLFENVKETVFDWIVINPPYYSREPRSESEFAWYCGEDQEYFRNLFRALPSYLRPGTTTIMVLTKGCDLDGIFRIGKNEGFSFHLLREQWALFDGKDMLYQLEYGH